MTTSMIIEGPRNFLLGEYAVNVGNSDWPIEWRPAYVQIQRVSAESPAIAHAHPIDKNGDWSGLYKILPADQVRY